MLNLDRTRRRFWSSTRLGLFVLACMLVANDARSQADDGTESLLRQGLELRREHRDVEALDVFQRAYAASPTPRARAQIAFAKQSLGQWIEAESDLRASLQEAADPWIVRNREPLEQALGFVTTHLGWLTVSTNVIGARISVNGAVVGTAPMEAPARVVIGTALILVEAKGYVAVERVAHIDANDHAHENVELIVARSDPTGAICEAPPLEAQPARLPLRPIPSRTPWGAIGVASVGVVGLAVGTIAGVDALTAKAARDQHCTSVRCDGAGLILDAHARRDALVSTVGFGLGAAALGAAAWLFLRERSDHAGSVAVVPVLDLTGRGIRVVRSW
jgi:hypothetical protein